MKFTEVPIEECWDDIRECVEKVQKTINANWSSDDVFDYCYEGHAAVFVCDDGFIILEPKLEPFTHKKQLLLWIAYGKKGRINLTEKYADDIMAIAKSIGADSVIGCSSRAGWSKKAIDVGWHYCYSVYEKEVT
ncbi:hypothetical protein [Pleionea sp. CnH1-48]|uniref:hypothetical protein n=1 Tax=Pleionea sp. CnH1-48 TaxID=2954494 RepID=UPI0020986586|nr:hypothetical protein [Pleionea sp. CnH1-48]MCO7225932.1 hypothetical protein [Pleionea sp. CnH1-48]